MSTPNAQDPFSDDLDQDLIFHPPTGPVSPAAPVDFTDPTPQVPTPAPSTQPVPEPAPHVTPGLDFDLFAPSGSTPSTPSTSSDHSDMVFTPPPSYPVFTPPPPLEPAPLQPVVPQPAPVHQVPPLGPAVPTDAPPGLAPADSSSIAPPPIPAGKPVARVAVPAASLADSSRQAMGKPPRPLSASIRRDPAGSGQLAIMIDGIARRNQPNLPAAIADLCAEAVRRQHAIVVSIVQGTNRRYLSINTDGTALDASPPAPDSATPDVAKIKRENGGAEGGLGTERENPDTTREWVERTMLVNDESDAKPKRKWFGRR